MKKIIIISFIIIISSILSFADETTKNCAEEYNERTLSVDGHNPMIPKILHGNEEGGIDKDFPPTPDDLMLN